MTTKAKVCGLTTKEAIKTAIDNNADFVGMVFFDKSPRNIDIKNAQELVAFASTLSSELKIVAVCVAPDNETLQSLKDIGIDWVQLHKIKDKNRLLEIQNMGFQTIMAFGISTAQDIENIAEFDGVADYILFDAKAPEGVTNEGGFGVSFDWNLLRNLKTKSPWILSGGLNAENVREAIAATNAEFVDVSSGIEVSLGIKDIDKIEKFLKAVKE